MQAIEIARPGFLNIRLQPAAKQEVVREVLAGGERFGCQPANGQQVLVEFVSANPTGPLHVGHGRQAALGMPSATCSAPRAGRCAASSITTIRVLQIQTLTNSTRLRARVQAR